MTTEVMEQKLGAAVVAALDHAKLTVKEACALQGLSTEAHFRAALRGEPGSQISLTRLIRLPFLSFWMAFAPSLIYLLAQRSVAGVAEDLHLRKAS